jgi:hypothetical protein
MSVRRLVRQHIGVAAIILGPGDREPITKAVEFLAVDGINDEATLEQGLHDRPVRGLHGNKDLARVASARLQQPGNRWAGRMKTWQAGGEWIKLAE